MLVWARTACVPVNERVMNRANRTVQRCAVQRRSLEVGCTLFWYDMFIPSSISVLHCYFKELWPRRRLLLSSCLRSSLRRDSFVDKDRNLSATIQRSTFSGVVHRDRI